MSETVKREPLSLVQTLLVILTAIVAAGVGYFEFQAAGIGYFEFEVPTPYRGLRFSEAFTNDAIEMAALLRGLMQAVPLLLLAAIFCAAYAVFQKADPRRRHALWVACGLLLAFVAGTAAHQALLYRAFIPALDRGRFEQAQLVGTLTSLGEPAPDITVTTVAGKTVHLADLRGSVVLLNFFATGCDPCTVELSELQKIWNAFPAQDGFQMLAIGRDESIESVQAFAGEQGITFPLAADADRAAFDQFATEGIPRLYLISPAGDIVFQCQGFHEQQMVALTTLLKAELAGH